MAERLQTVLDDKLAERVRRAAAKDRRSVSEWIALRLEEVLGSDGPSDAEVAKARAVVSCPHANTKREKAGASGLVMTKCLDCGGLLKV